jgi:hypothetical protein
MKIEANSPDEYVEKVPEERRPSFERLRQTVLDHLPVGFEEVMSYGMIGYVVPHSLYPDGYHCTPALPLPFMNIANQKNFIAFYHMGIYAEPELLQWFLAEYEALNLRKLDMGKSCIRFKKWGEIPFELIGKLVAKRSPEDWIAVYESQLKKKK